ncbi:MAG: hypothetical protein WD557_16865 [Dehalococcoidia bacterium]
MTGALEDAGCRILYVGPATQAPFVITAEAPDGERLGILAYAFRATRTPTKNRPDNERSFQLKYGDKKDNAYHDIYQDPNHLLTTLLVGIDIDDGFFVGVDPVLHNPTRMFIRVEFKDDHAERIKLEGWTSWERQRHAGDDGPGVEVLVGGTASRFLEYVRFERSAVGLDPGHRQLLAEKWGLETTLDRPGEVIQAIEAGSLHILETEFGLTAREVLDLIATAPRLKMAVRGWVAEEHLVTKLTAVDGVTSCQRIEADGKPDVLVRFRGHDLTIECKNVLRSRTSQGVPRLDFQRTRAAKADPCSRYYRPADFDLVAACLHPVTEAWEFRFRPPRALVPHTTCHGRIASGQLIDDFWEDAEPALLGVVS